MQERTETFFFAGGRTTTRTKSVCVEGHAQDAELARIIVSTSVGQGVSSRNKNSGRLFSTIDRPTFRDRTLTSFCCEKQRVVRFIILLRLGLVTWSEELNQHSNSTCKSAQSNAAQCASAFCSPLSLNTHKRHFPVAPFEQRMFKKEHRLTDLITLDFEDPLACCNDCNLCSKVGPLPVGLM